MISFDPAAETLPLAAAPRQALAVGEQALAGLFAALLASAGQMMSVQSEEAEAGWEAPPAKPTPEENAEAREAPAAAPVEEAGSDAARAPSRVAVLQQPLAPPPVPVWSAPEAIGILEPAPNGSGEGMPPKPSGENPSEPEQPRALGGANAEAALSSGSGLAAERTATQPRDANPPRQADAPRPDLPGVELPAPPETHELAEPKASRSAVYAGSEAIPERGKHEAPVRDKALAGGETALDQIKIDAPAEAPLPEATLPRVALAETVRPEAAPPPEVLGASAGAQDAQPPVGEDLETSQPDRGRAPAPGSRPQQRTPAGERTATPAPDAPRPEPPARDTTHDTTPSREDVPERTQPEAALPAEAQIETTLPESAELEFRPSPAVPEEAPRPSAAPSPDREVPKNWQADSELAPQPRPEPKFGQGRGVARPERPGTQVAQPPELPRSPADPTTPVANPVAEPERQEPLAAAPPISASPNPQPTKAEANPAFAIARAAERPMQSSASEAPPAELAFAMVIEPEREIAETPTATDAAARRTPVRLDLAEEPVLPAGLAMPEPPREEEPRQPGRKDVGEPVQASLRGPVEQAPKQTHAPQAKLAAPAPPPEPVDLAADPAPAAPKRHSLGHPAEALPQQPAPPASAVAAPEASSAAPPRSEPPPPQAAASSPAAQVETADLDQQPGRTQFRLVLRDDFLGRVSLNLTERAGLIDLMVRADKSTTVRTLQETLPMLVESLSHRNFRGEAAAFAPSSSLADHREPAQDRERRERRSQENRPRIRSRRVSDAFQISAP